MKTDWICRDYQSGNESLILNLANDYNLASWGKISPDRNITLKYWKWRYIDNPFGQGIIKLLFNNDQLIGHYAVTPVKFQVRDKLATAAFSLHTMTHPDYQKQGIFIYLAEKVYEECRNRGFSFVYGFPNNNSYYGFTQRLGWTGFGKIISMEKRLNIDNKKSLKANNIHEVNKFDNSVDNIWNKVKKDYRIIVPRVHEYLNWRFAEHPLIQYPKFVIKTANSELSGYMILKIYKDENITKGHIIDILAINDEQTIKHLLNHACNFFVERGIDNLSCWLPEKSYCSMIFKKEGFIIKEFDVNFGFKSLHEDSNNITGQLKELTNWHITMSDADIF